MIKDLERLLSIMRHCVLEADVCSQCSNFEKDYSGCRATHEEFFNMLESMIEEHKAMKYDFGLACESNNPCLVCGHFRQDRNGIEKCELNGWHCNWEWRGVQK